MLAYIFERLHAPFHNLSFGSEWKYVYWGEKGRQIWRNSLVLVLSG